MNLLEEIEGKNNEDLTSAVLRFLAVRAQPLRDQLIKALSKVSPVGPIYCDHHFACYSEHGTEDEEDGSGRVDLVLELDETVIGVENKIFARFQQGQPAKYLSTLQQVAKSRSEIRGGKIESFLVILAPRRRGHEIEEIAASHPRICVSYWEDLLSDFETELEKIDPLSKAVATEFACYMRSKIEFMPSFERVLPHLTKSFISGGTSVQKDFLGHVWEFFPSGGSRLSGGSTWSGYYFDDKKGWFGFVPGELVKGPASRPAEFVVVHCSAHIEKSRRLQAVELSDGQFMGPGRTYGAWRIVLDDSCGSPETWRDILEPFEK